jgi:LAO/AO transport system kinase
MEATDLVLVNKADGNLLDAAKHTKADYSGSMNFIRQKHDDWQAKVIMISAVTQLNMETALTEIYKYHAIMYNNGYLFQKRANQRMHWMQQSFYKRIIADVDRNTVLKEKRKELQGAVAEGRATARGAAKTLYDLYKAPYIG